MKMPDCQSHCEGVKLCPYFRKLSRLSKMHKQFATAHKLHYEKNLLFGLENVLHTNQEWMISLLQYLFL